MGGIPYGPIVFLAFRTAASSPSSSSSSISDPPGALFFPTLPSSRDLLVLSPRPPLTLGAVVEAPSVAADLSLLEDLPLLRFRDLITSVLSEMGRGRPFILKKSAQALHRTCVLSWERLHSGVVCKSIVSSAPLPEISRDLPGSCSSRRWVSPTGGRQRQLEAPRLSAHHTSLTGL